MEEQNREHEVRAQDLWSVFKHCWWQCVFALIIVAILVYIALSAVHVDAYTAQTSIYVLTPLNSGNSGNATTDYYTIQTASSLINDCEILIRSRDHVLQPVVTKLQLDENQGKTTDDLADMIHISRADNARVLYLSVTTSDPEWSAKIADELGQTACSYFNQIYNTELLNVVDTPQVPTRASNPISKLFVLLIGFFAAVVIYVIHFLRFVMDDKINSPEDVERYLGLSMLGVIPNRNDVGRKKSKYGYYYSYTAEGEKRREGGAK